MRWECRERFPATDFKGNRESGSLTCGGGENVPCIPGACETRNFMYPLLLFYSTDDCWVKEVDAEAHVVEMYPDITDLEECLQECIKIGGYSVDIE